MIENVQTGGELPTRMVTTTCDGSTRIKQDEVISFGGWTDPDIRPFKTLLLDIREIAAHDFLMDLFAVSRWS